MRRDRHQIPSLPPCRPSAVVAVVGTGAMGAGIARWRRRRPRGQAARQPSGRRRQGDRRHPCPVRQARRQGQDEHRSRAAAAAGCLIAVDQLADSPTPHWWSRPSSRTSKPSRSCTATSRTSSAPTASSAPTPRRSGDLDRRRPAAPRAPGRPALLQPGAADEAGRDRLRPRHRARGRRHPVRHRRGRGKTPCMRARRRASSSTASPVPTTPRRCASSTKAVATRHLDAIMRDAGGFRMGPFELMDMIGHDVNFAVTRSVWNAFFNDARFTLADPAGAGRRRLFGRKSGAASTTTARAPRPHPGRGGAARTGRDRAARPFGRRAWPRRPVLRAQHPHTWGEATTVASPRREAR